MNILNDRSNSGIQRSQNLPSALFDNAANWQGMSKEEMQTPLVVEFMKYMMGKTRGKEIRDLLEISDHHYYTSWGYKEGPSKGPGPCSAAGR